MRAQPPEQAGVRLTEDAAGPQVPGLDPSGRHSSGRHSSGHHPSGHRSSGHHPSGHPLSAHHASAQRRSDPDASDPERLRSTLWLRFFQHVLTQQLRKSFHAVRVARPGLPAISARLPLVVYCNHPSWWDGALVPVLMTKLFPARRGFGPIDAQALQRYPFMRKLGLFGVQPGSYAGAATFLRVGRRLLSQPDTLFCLTPQGSFADARQRPLRLRAGLAGLISTVPRVTVLPLALEYPFWDERLPEALLRFGEPLLMGSDMPKPLDEVRQTLEDRLAATMDALADDAASRDAGRFQTVLQGSVGIGGIYDMWRRLKAWRNGERFDPAHVPDQG